MHAIITKFVGPTNKHGQRVKAYLDGYSDPGKRDPFVMVPWNNNVDTFEAHLEGAKALCEKMGWKGTIHGGSTRTGYVFVFLKKVHEEGGAYCVGTTVAV